MINSDDNMAWQEALKGVVKIKTPSTTVNSSHQKLSRRKKQSETFMLVEDHGHEPDFNVSADIDKQTMKRFKREEFGVEATLDLHGYTMQNAYEAVKSFIFSSYKRGRRAILIITGKGLKHPDEDIFESKGVLKQSVPQWLQTDEIKGFILTYIHPSQKLGGTGAIYILLRRNKK